MYIWGNKAFVNTLFFNSPLALTLSGLTNIGYLSAVLLSSVGKACKNEAGNVAQCWNTSAFCYVLILFVLDFGDIVSVCNSGWL